MSQLKLTVELHPTQAAFTHSPALYRALAGGRGAGKSWIGSYDLLRRARAKGLYGVYAPTYGMLRDATYRTFKEIAEKMHFIREVSKSDFRLTLGNGAEVLFRSMDDPEHARGPNLAGCWLDEASLMPREAFDIAIGALRQEGQQGWLSATFTPKGKAHWTYEVFGEHKADTALFQASTKRNPFLPPEFYDTVKAQYAGQLVLQELEGEFIAPEGAIAQRAWFPVVDIAPAQARRARHWDFAATAPRQGADPDYTVGTRLALTDGNYYVESVVRGRWGPGDVEKVLRQTAETDGRHVGITIEQEPGSSGKLFTAAVVKALAGWTIRAVLATGDKITRAMPFFAQAQGGNVRLVRGAWNAAWLDEICAVPNGAHDDQMDSVSGAFAALTSRGGWAQGPAA